MPRDTKRIALFYPWRPGNAQEFLRGIFRYARPAKPWSFCLTFGADIEKLVAWRPDGVIGHFFSPAAIDEVRRLGVPAVDTAMDHAGRLPQVGLDDRAVGALAAEHLLDRGFRHFVFLGDQDKEFSRRTAKGFAGKLAEAGHAATTVPGHWFRSSLDELLAAPEAAAAWLGALPRPAAAFAAGDRLALQLLEAGRSGGLRVPDDLAVLGAGNVELLCSMAHPPLSSVQVAAEAAGFEAARLLDRLLHGEAAPGARIEFPPLGVVTRQSTDLLAITDAALAAALVFIREHATRNITVDDVARAAGLSRSSLERRFRDQIGRTPAREIRRVRVEVARRRLVETDWPMTRVAEDAGFRDGGHFSEAGATDHVETCHRNAAAAATRGETTMPPSPIALSSTRRRFLGAFGAGAAVLYAPGVFAQELVETPPQTEGPFYPDALPLDTDNDLLIVNDRITPAVGDVTHLSGRVLDRRGDPLRNVVVEIWQVDNHGAYLHPGSANQETRDGNFQGFGRFLTGSTGEYYFRTIKPVPYPGRTPHIHFKVKRSDRELLTTQCYVKDHAGNERDGILRGIRDLRARESVLVDFAPVPGSRIGELAVRFDIVLGVTPPE